MERAETKIIVYTTHKGKCPFNKWESSLEVPIRAKIRRRLAQVRLGFYGDAKKLKNTNGIYELRIHQSPGYRIYYGKQDDVLVILLWGGTKNSQNRDIKKAKEYWEDYLENKESWHE